MPNIVVGLGNPGPQYANTRHNVGFLFTDQLAQQLGTTNWQHHSKSTALLEKHSQHVWLVKPQTYMNQVGTSVTALDAYFKFGLSAQPGQLFVAFDDLDLEVGNWKLQLGTGPKTHNGLFDIYRSLGTDQFWHVRLGVDGRGGERVIPSDRYVLQPFAQSEQLLVNTMIEQAVDRVLTEINLDDPDRSNI